MGFLLLLLVGLATLVQVETNHGAQQLRAFQARQNALLGMRIALAQLQVETGPDQRITARAEILTGRDFDADGEPIEVASGTGFWTGVWRAEDPNGVWLVSGADADPFNELATDSVTMVSGFSPAGDGGYDPVIVNPVAIDSDGGSFATNRFGYWIGDDGVKARVNLINSYRAVDDEAEGFRNALLSAQRFGVEAISGLSTLTDFALASTPAEDVQRLRRVGSREDLVHLNEELSTSDVPRRHWHSITTDSMGLLTDTRNGGLRIDLTRGFEDDAIPETQRLWQYDQHYGPQWRLFKEFYNLHTITDGIHPELAPRVPNGLSSLAAYARRVNTSDGQIFDWYTGPYLTPIMVAMGMTHGLRLGPFDGPLSEEEDEVMREVFHNEFGDDADFDTLAPPWFAQYQRLIAGFQPVVVMANPYNVALAETDYEFSLRSEINSPPQTVLVEGHYEPRIDVIRPDNDGQGANRIIRLSEWLPEYEPLMQVNYRVSFRAGFEPGEIKLFVIDPSSGNPDANGMITSRTFELVEGTPAYITRWLEYPVPLRQGIAREMDAPISGSFLPSWADDDPNHLPSWEDYLDSRMALVRRDYSGVPFQINTTRLAVPRIGSGQGRQLRFEIQGFTRSHDMTEDEPLVVAKARSYFFKTDAGAYSSGTADTLGEDRMRPLIHRAFRLKDSTVDNQSIRSLIVGNIRSPHHGFVDHADDANAWLGWGTNSPVYTEVHGGGVNYLFSPSVLWEPEDDSDNSIVLFHIPRERLVSIGDFQHLNVAWSVFAPTYAIGNSYASPWMDADQTFFEFRHGGDNAINPYHYDLSWQLNDILWDRYYFSTWPRQLAGEEQAHFPLNRRMNSIEPLSSLESLDYRQLAGGLMIDGAFNINSTSVEAWKALLASLNQQALLYRDTVSATEEEQVLLNPVLRSPYPSGDGNDFWRGFRELTGDQIQSLAVAIVAEIKERGPFLSLAQFVNRTIAPESNPHSLKGAIQAAIDSSGVNDLSWNSAPQVTHDPAGNFRNLTALNGHRVDGGTGFITQADILRVLGPILSARSDTFTIRAYGEVANPLDGTTRAWCEAVVQRVPQWLTDDPNLQPHDLPDELAERFGRRYRVLSFRWLSPNEI